MAITIRWPSGTSATYNDANYLIRNQWGWELMTRKGGRDVVTIQPTSGIAVEFERPCSVSGGETDEARLRYLLNHCREIRGWREAKQLAELKVLLRDFDARTGSWK